MRRLFGERARLQAMLDFEAALARAEAHCGVIPAAAVEPIGAGCRAELYDLDALAGAAALAGNPAIPMVQALKGRVGGDAARFVHFGATSQDAMDTGLVLGLRAALEAIEGELDRLAAALAELARAHRGTLIVGRTWLQHAQPTTFGLKVAGWLDALGRDRARLAEWRTRGLVVELGGAVGNLAALGPRGLDVVAALAAELGLGAPRLPWHTARDRVAEAGTVLALLVGTLGKIGRDVSLLMQTEVGEAFEPDAPGRGGSSAMPQKRNPVGSAAVLAAAARVPALASVLLAAMPQAHERGLGDWPAEWDTLPEICDLAAEAAAQTATVVAGLEVDPARMRANLDATRGQIFAGAVASALAQRGEPGAHGIVERACRRAAAEGRHLRDVLGATPEVTAFLSDAELDRLFDPAAAIGLAHVLVDRVVNR